MIERSIAPAPLSSVRPEELPPREEVQRAFRGACEPPSCEFAPPLYGEPKQHKVLVLPVVENALCEHHLVIYTAPLHERRMRLAAFARRQSRDPDVPSRPWRPLCSAEMPEERLEEFVALLQERLDGPSLELRDLALDPPPET